MSAVLAVLPDRLSLGVTSLEDVLDSMPIAAWSGLEAETVRGLATRLLRVEARLEAHQQAAARALEASGLAKESGATSTGALLAKGFGGDRRAGDRRVNQGQALEKAPATESALAAGRIGGAQAGIIAGAIGGLPAGVTDEQKQACEEALIDDAGKYSLKDLRARSRRASDQYQPAPEADKTENDNVEAEEKRAWAKSQFWMQGNGDGTTTGGFTLPDAQADMLDAAIKAICAPKRDHLRDHPGTQSDTTAGTRTGTAGDTTGTTGGASTAGDSSSDAGAHAGQGFYDRELEWRTRMGAGFAELCSRIPGHLLPGRTGLGATLVVRLDLDTLRDGIKAATLSTGTRISASQARLMACTMGIIPQVFGGPSLPLDHGRERRLFSKAQNQAFAARDHGCCFPGCDRPPEQSEAHHWRMSWARGGTTNLDDGCLLCPFHHRLVHSQGWDLRLGPDSGRIEFRAPGTTIWQTNHRWRP